MNNEQTLLNLKPHLCVHVPIINSEYTENVWVTYESFSTIISKVFLETRHSYGVKCSCQRISWYFECFVLWLAHRMLPETWNNHSSSRKYVTSHLPNFLMDPAWHSLVALTTRAAPYSGGGLCWLWPLAAEPVLAFALSGLLHLLRRGVLLPLLPPHLWGGWFLSGCRLLGTELGVGRGE